MVDGWLADDGGCRRASAGDSFSVPAAVEATEEPRTPHPRSQRLWRQQWAASASPPALAAAGATAEQWRPPPGRQRLQERQQGRRHSPLCRRRRQWIRCLPPRLHAWVTPRTPPMPAHAPPCPPIPFESSWSQHRGARWVGWPWIFAAPTWRTARHRGEPESCDTHRPLQVALNRRNEPRQGICLGANYQQKTPYCVLSSRPPVRWAPSEHGDEMLFPAMCAARPPGRLQRHPSLRRICRGATTTPEPPTTQG
jgi:hypothetical protein